MTWPEPPPPPGREETAAAEAAPRRRPRGALRVLFCNWVSPLDPQRRGGGVAAYERHLRSLLQAEGITAGFLNSGLAQDLRPGPPRREDRGAGIWRLVNAAPLAPSHLSFGDPAQLHHAPTEAAFAAFLAETGPWNVIHFNNLEGFPAGVLPLARAHAPRVLLMLHNYYPLCPQVNLWFQERMPCPGPAGGANCARCLPHPPGARARLSRALTEALIDRGGSAGARGYQALVSGLRGLRGRRPLPAADPGPLPAAPVPAALAQRRAEMLRLLNENCDALLCVSERVREIALGSGLRADLLKTCRISSPDAARPPAPPRPLLHPDGTLTLAYAGYLRRDKGFFFLLEALETLPPRMAERIRLILAARPGDPALTPRIRALAGHLAGLRWHRGYQPRDLDRLLAPATLGLVPVLWEDNLPQVALEMHLRGLALLTSDRGGARELGNCPALTFPAGEVAAFHDRLRAVLAGEVTRADYGRGGAGVPEPRRHLAELLQHWRGEG